MRSSLKWSVQVIFLSTLPAILLCALFDTTENVEDNSTTKTSTTASMTSVSKADSDLHLNHVTSNVAQESSNFFTDIGPPSFSSKSFESPEYESLFDTFPSMPYFPEFGEIFRIQRSTTPNPPFRFPDYVRDPFPERPPESPMKPLPGRGESGVSVTGGRRPSRRPPRPASSGTKTKLVKQNHSEPKEKIKPGKSKPPSKARDYPKIFRFTADRVNLAEFDMRKKTNGKYASLAKGDDLDSNKIQRNKFLILHGGIFRIEQPMSNGIYGANSDVVPVTENVSEFGARTDHLDAEMDSPYYHET